MEAMPTVAGVNPAQTPARVLAEFSGGAIDPKASLELEALEAQIAALQDGKAVPPPPAPAEATPPLPAPSPEPVAQLAQPAAPVQQSPANPSPEPIATAPAIPDKFKTPDGTLDAEKLDKSLTALNAYLEKERELTRLRQGQVQSQPFQPTQVPQAQPGVIPNFEQEIQQGLQTNPAGTIINLVRAAMHSNRESVFQEIQDLRLREELRTMAQADPGILTKESVDKLAEVRRQRPYLDQSPTPWLDAYLIHRGQYGPLSPVPATTQAPAGQAPRPPHAPVVPGDQPPPPPTAGVSQIRTEEDLKRHLDSVTREVPSDKKAQAQADYLEKVFSRMAKQ